MADKRNGGKLNGNNCTVAVAAVVLNGSRNLRKAQWLKMYDREEDKFFAVRPFIMVMKNPEIGEKLIELFSELPKKLERDGIAYIGDLSFESVDRS